MPGYTLKRPLDICLSLAMLVVALPFILFAIALTFIDGHHNPLFLQKRLGLHGKKFTIYKFRTMKSAAGHTLHTKPSAPELTPIGRFLRNTGIDELPQLVNILKGDMSLIGPRPHAVTFAQHYAAAHPRYYERYAVRPGLACIVEVTALHYLTEDAKHIRMRVNCDLYYIRHISLGLDLKMMYKVCVYMFKHYSAYASLPGVPRHVSVARIRHDIDITAHILRKAVHGRFR